MLASLHAAYMQPTPVWSLALYNVPWVPDEVIPWVQTGVSPENCWHCIPNFFFTNPLMKDFTTKTFLELSWIYKVPKSSADHLLKLSPTGLRMMQYSGRLCAYMLDPGFSPSTGRGNYLLPRWSLPKEIILVQSFINNFATKIRIQMKAIKEHQ